MKKKSYKLIKGVIATALAGIMVTSFAGCHHKSIKEEDVQESEKKIQIVNEDDQELSVIGFVRDSKAIDEEKYGYINFDNMEFYDVLTDKTIDLKVLNKNNDIYYTNLKDVLTTEDYYVLASNGYIGKEQLKEIETQSGFSKKIGQDRYYLYENYCNSYRIISSEFTKMNFVDDQEKEKNHEETTLAINR